MTGENNNLILSNRQKRAIEIASKIAKNSRCLHRHGAVLVSGGGVLVNIAFNKNEFCSFGTRFLPAGANYDYATRHAEINACLNIPVQLTSGGTVYVVRVNAGGILCNSRPCDLCQSVMQFCKIRRVVYSCGDNKFGEMRL